MYSSNALLSSSLSLFTAHLTVLLSSTFSHSHICEFRELSTYDRSPSTCHNRITFIYPANPLFATLPFFYPCFLPVFFPLYFFIFPPRSIYFFSLYVRFSRFHVFSLWQNHIKERQNVTTWALQMADRLENGLEKRKRIFIDCFVISLPQEFLISR